MTKNYFAIERNGNCVDHILFKDKDERSVFEDVINMSYDEVKAYEHIEEFVTCVMDATNVYFNECDSQTVVTLIDKSDIFVWSIIIGPDGDNGDLRYVFIDWQKDGKSYRYEKD